MNELGTHITGNAGAFVNYRDGTDVESVFRPASSSPCLDLCLRVDGWKPTELSAMTQMIRKTESKFPGLWILDRAALFALDEIIDEQWSRLEAHKKDEIEAAVRTQGTGPESRPPTL